jgi:subfamily B ATP-binding cassette protein MsbA
MTFQHISSQAIHRLRLGADRARRQPIIATVGALWPYLKREWRRLLLAGVISLSFSTVEVSAPILLGGMVDTIIAAINAQTPATAAVWAQRSVIALLLVLALARGALYAAQRALAGRIGEQVASRMRLALWQHVQDLPLESVHRRGPGRLLVRFVSDARAVQRLVTDGLLNTTHEMFIGVMLVLTLLAVNWRMGLIVALVAPVYAVLFRRENPRLRAASRARRRRRTRMSAYLSERINGLTVVKAFSRQTYETGLFGDLTRKLANRGAKVARIGGRMQGYGAAIAAITSALVLVVAAGEADAGRMTAGRLVVFYTVLGLLLPILRQVVIANRYFQEAQISVERLSETLSEPTEASDDIHRPDLRISAGSLTVEGVSYSHRNGTLALDRVSIHARRGELVAIVGPNGAGKSTLLELIMRFRRPRSGRICVDDQDIAGVAVASLRRQCGYVTGDMPLFDGSLKENVLYAAPPDVSAAHIERAMRLAGADAVVAALPQGWETRVGEGGRMVSAGHRQRIALARALMPDPAVMLLDEATSAVDQESEHVWAQSLRALADAKTVIVVAHRVPTLMLADRIYVLDQGRVVEQGRHRDLILENGMYARLFGHAAHAQPECAQPESG